MQVMQLTEALVKAAADASQRYNVQRGGLLCPADPVDGLAKIRRLLIRILDNLRRSRL